MEHWLKSSGLEQYAPQSLELGYDDPTMLGEMDQGQMEKWADAVDMKPGHRVKLLAQWKHAITSRDTSPVQLIDISPPVSPKSVSVEIELQPPSYDLPVVQPSVVAAPAELPSDLRERITHAQYPPFGKARPPIHPTSKSLRRQLICSFVPMVIVTFGVVILAAGIGLSVTKEQAVTKSQGALRSQVTGSTGAFIRDAGQAFENRLLEGISGFLLPMVHTYADAVARAWPYSFAPPPSYADTPDIAPGVPRLIATSNDERHPARTNLSTSSVFFPYQGGQIPTLWANHANDINQTAHMDRFLISFFATHPEWQAGYIGLESSKLFRYFPGYISDKQTSNYDTTTRLWYINAFLLAAETKARTTSALQSLLDNIYITPPYPSFSLETYMISLSHALYDPTPCIDKGLTTCPDSIVDTGKKGVACVQMFIKTIQELIDRIKAGQNGQAHLFMSATGEVVASPQWVVANQTMLMSRVQILSQGPFTPAILNQMTGRSGTIIVGDALIVYTKVIQDRFTLAMVTSVTEISAPINNQIDDLAASADSLLGVVVGVGIVVMLLVIFVVYWVSELVVRPLQAVAEDSARISGSIGSSGGMVPPANKKIFIGEVNQLRIRFNNMLKGYMNKRTQPDTFIRKNPFYQSTTLPTPPTAGAHQLENLLRSTQQLPANSSLLVLEDSPIISCKNRMSTILTVCVTGPILVGVLIIIIIVSTELSEKSIEWVQPVRDAMIATELAALPVRTVVLQEVVTSMFRRAGASLSLFHEQAEALWNVHAGLPSPLNGQLLGPYGTFYVPLSRAGNMPDSLSHLPLGGLDFDPRFPGVADLTSNFHASAFYKNKNSGYNNEPGYAVPEFAVNDPILQLQSDMSHLDNVARTVYFSNDQILALYFVDEQYETYRQFPYRSKESFPSWQGQCFALGAVYRTGYTPVCRNWYVAAKQHQEQDNWVPVYTSASTGYVMISVSRAVRDASGSFVGVVCMDLHLEPLNRALRQAKLYENGYAYLVDREGLAVLHPMMNFADTKTYPFIDFEMQTRCGAEERAAFAREHEPRITSATISGQSSYARCGETWYLSWAPIEGTSYVLVLTMPHTDITKEAEELSMALNKVLVGMIIGWVVVAAVALLTSLCVGIRLSRQFAESLASLSKYLEALHAENYARDMPDTEANSYELELIVETIKELLIALRFGNPAFAKGDVEKEFQNYLLALEIVNRNESYLGVGVVQNNVGNTARLCSEKGNFKPARMHLEESIQCALVEVQSDGVKALDTLGQRLFNLGLLEVSENLVLAAKIFNDVLAIHGVSRNGEVLTRYAYALSKLELPDEKGQGAPNMPDLPPAYQDEKEMKSENSTRRAMVGQWMQIFASEGLKLLTPGPSTPGCIAMACLAMRDNRSEWCVWALRNIPEMSVFLVCGLAQTACASYLVCDATLLPLSSVIDPVMREEKNVQWVEPARDEHTRTFKVVDNTQGVTGPRNFLFCLDVSGSMGGSRLQNCKDAAEMILTKHVKPTDFGSLVTFGSTAQLQLPLQPYSSNLLVALRNMAPYGSTAFYDALVLSVTELSKPEGDSRSSWLIALTDGDDNSSSIKSLSKVEAALRRKKINLAIITVGQLSESSLRRIQDLCLAARAGDGEGKHFVAQNTADISKAFQEVADLIPDSGAQVWQAL